MTAGGPEIDGAFDRTQLQGMRGLRELAEIPDTAQRAAIERGLEFGLEAAE